MRQCSLWYAEETRFQGISHSRLAKVYRRRPASAPEPLVEKNSRCDTRPRWGDHRASSSLRVPAGAAGRRSATLGWSSKRKPFAATLGAGSQRQSRRSPPASIASWHTRGTSLTGAAGNRRRSPRGWRGVGPIGQSNSTIMTWCLAHATQRPLDRGLGPSFTLVLTGPIASEPSPCHCGSAFGCSGSWPLGAEGRVFRGSS